MLINTRNDRKFPLTSRETHPDPTVIEVGGVRIGGGALCIIAGPCAVESEAQLMATARRVKEAGADMLRGGAFKPRTSPYSFRGLGVEGLRLLLKAGRETGLPVVSEILSAGDIDLFTDVDVIQVGARNMQNFELLEALGRTDKPVLLKRGFANTVEELLMSAEYILAGGNSRVILCERGIRTFETGTRSTLDLSAVPLLRELTYLPVIVDPSHAAGKASLVPPLTAASAAVGADGVMVEVHCDPAAALSDREQALTPEEFARAAADARRIRRAMEAGA